MSVQPSLLKCPTCPDRQMETVTTALGPLERCPSCLSLWIEHTLVAAYSDDKAACREALAETHALLLPTDRWCPKCFQKMVDGRVRSRRVVLHLCTTCEALWTDWDTLRKFDEFIERALKVQVESASQNPLPSTQSPGPASSAGSGAPAGWPQLEDTGVGKVFRTMARTFDSIADGVGGTSAYTQPKSPKPVNKKPPVKAPPAKPLKEPPNIENKERKILKADELPPAPSRTEATFGRVEPETPLVANFPDRDAVIPSAAEQPSVPDPIVSGTVTAHADEQAPAAPDPIVSGTGTAGADEQAPAAPDPIVSGTGTAHADEQAPAAPDPIVSGTGTAGADEQAPAAPDPIVSGTGTAHADEQAPAAPDPIVSGTGTAGANEQAPAAPDPIVSGTGTAGANEQAPAAPDVMGTGPSYTVGAKVPGDVEDDPVISEKEMVAAEKQIIAAVPPPFPAPVVAEVKPEPVSIPVEPTPLTVAPLPEIAKPLEDKKIPREVASTPPAEEVAAAENSATAIPSIQAEESAVPRAEVIEVPTEIKQGPESATVEPQPTTEAAGASSAISNLLGGSWEEEEKPKKEIKKPIVRKANPPGKNVPSAKPLFSKGEQKSPGLFAKWGGAFKSKPRTPKAVTSVTSPQAVPAAPAKPPAVAIPPAPATTSPASRAPAVPVNPPAIIAKPATLTPATAVKSATPTLSEKLKGMFKSNPKVSRPAPVVAPAKPASLKPAPIVAKPEPTPTVEFLPTGVEPGTSRAAAEAPKPMLPKPDVPKSATKPVGGRPKIKRPISALAVRLLPWILALMAFLLNYARGYDFEFSFALLWSACAWSVGTMVRLFLLYPFQDFMEIPLSALAEYPGLSAIKGFPVILHGFLEPENPNVPKGPLHFVQDEKQLPLNKTGMTDIISNLFGLKNPAHLTQGEVTLRGWYRKTELPYLDVQSILVGKKRRASSVRALRWAAAIAVLVVSGLILMTAE